MTEWIDKLVVFLALIVSAGYAAYALGPRALRRWIAVGLTRAAPRTPRILGLQGVAVRLAAAAAAKSPGGCGGCDDCGANAAPGSGSGKGGAGASSGSEVVVPLRKVSRRRPQG